MGDQQFVLTPKTLRYERVGFSFWRTFNCGGDLQCFLGSYFYRSERGPKPVDRKPSWKQSLNAENKALTEYKSVLTSQLPNQNVLFGELKSDEAALTEKTI